MAVSKPADNSESVDPSYSSFHQRHRHNFLMMALYHVFVRTGWIFKTESIIMPAVLDLIGGQGWLRGCLPMLSRFGQSIPPLLISDWLRNRELKKWAMAGSAMLMGICFLTLSFVWWYTGGARSWWLPVVFLLIYAVFFASTGINQLVFSTMTGKLIEVQRRGRLMLISTSIGAVTAISCVVILLNRWLGQDNGNFVNIFAFTGFAFLIAGFLTLLLRETEDVPTGTKRNSLDLFKMSIETLVEDRNFRRLAIIGSLFGMSMTLLPHYQALARGGSSLGLKAMIPWLIAQNIGATMFAVPVGWAGDRFGYRKVLRIVMFAICVAPIFVLLVANMGESGKPYYIFIFCLLGLTPVTMRVFNNYTLEIVKSKYHPRYLSTLSLCVSAPAIITSSLIGGLMDLLGFEFIYGFILVLIFIGWVMTFGLEEPRESRK